MRSSRECEAALRTRYPIIREQPESRSANCQEIADKLSGRRAGFVTLSFLMVSNLLEGHAVPPIDARLLSHIAPFRDAIYAAGRHVNEALYSRVAGKFSEMNRTFVVDFVSNGRRQLASRIIGQFGHMNDGLHVLQVLHCDVTKILGERQWCRSAVPIERTFLVKASVQANDFIALPDQLRR